MVRFLVCMAGLSFGVQSPASDLEGFSGFSCRMDGVSTRDLDGV